jgi:hypothetical protein
MRILQSEKTKIPGISPKAKGGPLATWQQAIIKLLIIVLIYRVDISIFTLHKLYTSPQLVFPIVEGIRKSR